MQMSAVNINDHSVNQNLFGTLVDDFHRRQCVPIVITDVIDSLESSSINKCSLTMMIFPDTQHQKMFLEKINNFNK